MVSIHILVLYKKNLHGSCYYYYIFTVSIFSVFHSRTSSQYMETFVHTLFPTKRSDTWLTYMVMAASSNGK